MRGHGDTLNEKCAVVGISVGNSGNDAAFYAAGGLEALQHRGVEGTGIVATDGGAIDEGDQIREPGMVQDVHTVERVQRLKGAIAVGHNRYSTNGGRNAHLQPVIDPEIGLAMAHNGNLPDTESLSRYLNEKHYAETGRYNDSELLGHAIASRLREKEDTDIHEALVDLNELAVGAYACVMTYDGIVAGFRDPHGIRPLEIGRFDGGMMFASETCAIDKVGAEHVRSVEPGEVVQIRNGKIVSEKQFAEPNEHFDVFEMVYFARPDSYMMGQRVDSVRRRLGEELANIHTPLGESENAVVVPVPATSIPSSEAYAAKLGLLHQSAIYKNPYSNRTFMLPSQTSRQTALKKKHTIIKELVDGKDVVLIDDSIVRGNTMPRLVSSAREMGAKSVSILVGSPPVRFPDFYGVDTPSQKELIAANRTPEEMRKDFDADYLGFLPVSALVRATGIGRERLNLAAFNRDYPVSIGRNADNVYAPVSEEYID